MTRKLICVLLIAFGASVLSINCASEDARSENGSNGKTENADATKDEKGKDSKKKIERIPVETTKALAGDIASYILLSSNLETERMADVYSRVQGLIKTIQVEEGEHVKQGELLLELEPEELAFEEARAEVEYEQEKNLYERKQQMYEKNLLSNEEFEIAKFSLEAKRIAWQEAKLNLGHTKITSPLSGVIGERLKRPGDRIQPNDKLFSVINNDEMIAIVYVPEKEIGNIEKNQKAFITSDHLEEKKYQGWIKRVSPVVDPQSGTFKVTVGIRNENNRLRPGMFVNVHIITNTHHNAVLIPKTAVLYENERMYVFVVNDSVAAKVQLDVGYQDYEKIESLSGIEKDSNIIVVGQAGLKDSTRVNVIAERENKLQTASSIE